MNSNIVSLKIKGNPMRQGGYGSICRTGNSSFDWQQSSMDGEGMVANSYYFMFRVEAQQTVFVLKMNNVKTADLHAGWMEIGVAVPKNKSIDNGTPFILLKELMNEILMKHMQENAGVYQYKTTNFNIPAIMAEFERILAKYPLVDQNPVKPYRPMEGTSIGYMQLSDPQIEDLFACASEYLEFEGYKEVLVGTSVSNAPCIQGLEIPRVPKYEIIYDGVLQDHRYRAEEYFKISEPVESRLKDCYQEGTPYNFKVSDVVEGRCLDKRVKFNPETETITLEKIKRTPKRKTVKVHVTLDGKPTKDYDSSFNVKLSNSGRIIEKQIRNTMFELSGEEILYNKIEEIVPTANFDYSKVKIKPNKYSNWSYGKDDTITIELASVEPTKPKSIPTPPAYMGSAKSISKMRVLLGTDKKNEAEGGCKVIVKGTTEYNTDEYIKVTRTFKVSKKEYNDPKNINGVEIELPEGFAGLTEKEVILYCMDEKEQVVGKYTTDLKIKNGALFADFKTLDRTLSKGNGLLKKTWVKIVSLVLALAIGGAAGWGLTTWLHECPAIPNSYNEESGRKGNFNGSGSKTSSAENKKNKEQEKWKAQIRAYKDSLRVKDLKFATVLNEIAPWCEENQEAVACVDTTFLAKVEAYNAVCTMLKNNEQTAALYYLDLVDKTEFKDSKDDSYQEKFGELKKSDNHQLNGVHMDYMKLMVGDLQKTTADVRRTERGKQYNDLTDFSSIKELEIRTQSKTQPTDNWKDKVKKRGGRE